MGSTGAGAGMSGGKRGGGGARVGQGSQSGEAQNGCTLGQINADAVPYELVETRLQTLEADVNPTPEQANAWQDFVKRVRAYATEVDRQHTPSHEQQGSSQQTVDGIKYMAATGDRVRNRYTLLENIEPAVKRLYKVLTPQQRTLVDMRLPSIVAPRFANPKCPQLAY